ncbi:unnamed protein product [Amoebophrya sp. A120]|nr:unnamed protein product [Amoebophrya sp. A120]|eukprot:GSA120T00007291001.1
MPPNINPAALFSMDGATSLAPYYPVNITNPKTAVDYPPGTLIPAGPPDDKGLNKLLRELMAVPKPKPYRDGDPKFYQLIDQAKERDPAFANPQLNADDVDKVPGGAIDLAGARSKWDFFHLRGGFQPPSVEKSRKSGSTSSSGHQLLPKLGTSKNLKNPEGPLVPGCVHGDKAYIMDAWQHPVRNRKNEPNEPSFEETIEALKSGDMRIPGSNLDVSAVLENFANPGVDM